MAATVIAAETEKSLLLYGVQIIDGIAVGPGARVLLTAQSDPTENGVWVVQRGGWIRPTNFFTRDPETEVKTTVQLGNQNAATIWSDQIVDQLHKELEKQFREARPLAVQDTTPDKFPTTDFVSSLTVPKFTDAQKAAATGSLQALDLSTQVDGERVELALDVVLQNKTVILTINGLVQSSEEDYYLSSDGKSVVLFTAPEATDLVLLYYI